MTERSELDRAVAELLSAYVDGAVTPEERAEAEDWIARSDAARAEHAALVEAKQFVQGLPPVDPPFGFYERMLRQGTPTPALRGGLRSTLSIGAAVASMAAAWLLVGGTLTGAAAEQPPLEAATIAQLSAPDGVQTLRGTGMPGELGAFALDGTYGAPGDGVLATYVDDQGSTVAVLRTEGAVDWDSLPEGVRGRGDGVGTWLDLTTTGDLERAVIQRGDTIFTLVGEIDGDELVRLGSSLQEAPNRGRSLVDRARDACRGLLFSS